MNLDQYEIETKKLKFKNIETGIVKQFTVREMIYEINRARARDWIDFDVKDWQEGMEQFTEWRLI